MKRSQKSRAFWVQPRAGYVQKRPAPMRKSSARVAPNFNLEVRPRFGHSQAARPICVREQAPMRPLLCAAIQLVFVIGDLGTAITDRCRKGHRQLPCTGRRHQILGRICNRHGDSGFKIHLTRPFGKERQMTTNTCQRRGGRIWTLLSFTRNLLRKCHKRKNNRSCISMVFGELPSPFLPKRMQQSHRSYRLQGILCKARLGFLSAIFPELLLYPAPRWTHLRTPRQRNLQTRATA